MTDRLSPGPVAGITNAVQVVVGENLACARLADLTVSCWGYNEYGQVGDGTTINRTTPTAVPGLSGVNDLQAGENHVCALLTDLTVSCWGYNAHGEIGDGSTTNRLTPTRVPGLVDVTQISLGTTHSCARVGSGALCWGDEYALIGGGANNRLTPTPIAF